MSPSGKWPLLKYGQNYSSVSDVFHYRDSDSGAQNVSEIIPWASKSSSLGDHWENQSYYTDPSDLAIYGDFSAGCQHAKSGGHVMVKGSCLKDVKQPGGPDHTRFTRSALSPGGCAPSERAHLFINSSNAYDDGCQAARELSRSIALTCVLGPGLDTLGALGPLPDLSEPEDIQKLENWIGKHARNARLALSRLYVTNVPKRVVVDYEKSQVSTAGAKGQHGQLVLDYRGHLTTIGNGWQTIEKQLIAIKDAIKNARTSLTLSDLASDAELKKLAMEEVGLYGAMAKAVIGAAAGVAKAMSDEPAGAGFGVASAGVDLATASAQLGLMQDLKKIKNKEKANKVIAILTTLHEAVNDRVGNVESTLAAMQLAAVEAQKTGLALEQSQNKAKYHAAKGSGADFVEIGGKVVKFPVNTVLRRQYDLTKRRYAAALKEAKYLAYMARLAVEQRIGQRLDEIDGAVGALDAPSTWANEICSLTGVNYEALSQSPPTNGDDLYGTLFAIMNEMKLAQTNPYVGDYVDKLERFVEFYNIEYPSHEGDDIAVLSLRDDLLGPQGQCYRPSQNLLLHSDNLTKKNPIDEGATPEGWQPSNCQDGDAKCLAVLPGSILRHSGQPMPPPGVAPVEGITWLHEIDTEAFESDGGVGTNPTEAGAPSNTVYQTVQLDVGTYALSWFDSVRGSTPDETPTSAGADYTVRVYDAGWNSVAVVNPSPFVPAASVLWSERRVLPFTVTTPGEHHVLFGASASTSAAGSVAIADVQLESAASANAVTAYEHTEASRLILSGNCIAGNAVSFRNAFGYACNSKGCYYDLSQPFTIDFEALAAGGSALAGKIAQDNFNYRNVNVALNVVGTGVVDCVKAPTPSCFGSPYLEYTLEHDAFAAGIIDYEGVTREFNFGSGGIFYGKGLAAERFITLPISSSDQAMLSQPAFTKVELRGRPLSGTYRLRVHENPSLVWNHVEDIQVVLTYRYWSRITRDEQQN